MRAGEGENERKRESGWGETKRAWGGGGVMKVGRDKQIAEISEVKTILNSES